MRRLLGLVVLAVLCLGLVACSNGIQVKAKGRTEVGVSVGGNR